MKRLMQGIVCAAGLTAAFSVTVAGISGCSNGAAQLPDTLKVQNVDAAGNVITVTGKEVVKVVPDMAQIEYSIFSQEATAEACQARNSEDLNKAITILKGLGVDEKSIQTSSYGLNPIHDWNSPTQEITGYEMNTSLLVSDIPIDQAGAIMSQSVAAGVNRIDSVSYFASNYDASYQEALKGAMDMAQRKAEALAEAGGKTIAGVARVEEAGYNPNTRYFSYNTAGGMMAAEEETPVAADMAVMPGQVRVEAQVIVDYELN